MNYNIIEELYLRRLVPKCKHKTHLPQESPRERTVTQMKISELITNLGEACKNYKFSREYDVTNELVNQNGEQPRFHWHFKGNFSFSPVKVLASVAVIASVLAVAESVKSIASLIRNR